MPNTVESLVSFLLILFVIFTVASSAGIVIGVYFLFDNERKSCKSEIQFLRSEIMRVRLDAEAREQEDKAAFESLARKHQELSDLVLRMAQQVGNREIRIEAGGDMTVGEFSGSNREIVTR